MSSLLNLGIHGHSMVQSHPYKFSVYQPQIIAKHSPAIFDDFHVVFVTKHFMVLLASHVFSCEKLQKHHFTLWSASML
jgi:hypothetical protein